MELKEAIEIIEDLIDGNKARLSTVIHIYDRECIALYTVLQALENSIPKQVIEELREKIYEDLDGNALSRAYQISIDGYFKELLEGK